MIYHIIVFNNGEWKGISKTRPLVLPNCGNIALKSNSPLEIEGEFLPSTILLENFYKEVLDKEGQS
jgi:hypothetical protein